MKINERQFIQKFFLTHSHGKHKQKVISTEKFQTQKHGKHKQTLMCREIISNTESQQT